MTASSPRSTPSAVTWLGYGGLLPFTLLALAIYLFPQHNVFLGRALLGYGAVILSFTGALHWGFAMTLQGLSPEQKLHTYLWSVVPALVAWLALVFDSAPVGCALLVAGFLANYWRDVCVSRVTELPSWYLPLRFRLTTVACLCLLAFAVASLT